MNKWKKEPRNKPMHLVLLFFDSKYQLCTLEKGEDLPHKALGRLEVFNYLILELLNYSL